MSKSRILYAVAGLVLGAAVAIPLTASSATRTVSITPGNSAQVSNCTTSLALVVRTVSCAPRSTTTTTRPPATTTTTKPPVTTTTTAPTTTTTVPPTTTTTTQPAGTNCITGNGQLGPYFDPSIYFSNGNGTTTYVKNQNTGANTGTTETLCDPNVSPANWTVAANMSGRTNVQYFPDMQEVLTTAVKNPTGQGQLLSGFSSLTSTFNTTSPPASSGNWESAYDVWLDNRAGDVMVWENTSTARLVGNGAKVISSSVTIAGQSFTLLENCPNVNNVQVCTPTSDEVMLVHNTNVAAGSENLLADIAYLQGTGDVPAATGVSEINFGWEICGTAGTTEDFALNGYRLAQTPAG